MIKSKDDNIQEEKNRMTRQMNNNNNRVSKFLLFISLNKNYNYYLKNA